MSIEERYAEARKFYDNDEYDKAVPLLKALADEGHIGAQYCLGECYGMGAGVEKDEFKGIELVRKAAEQGNVEAQTSLSACYLMGNGVAKDPAESIKWALKAAEQGSLGAQGLLGDCYYNGNGVEKDYAKAFKWYSKAAEQGYVGAQKIIAQCYYDGIGVAKDDNKAFEWLRKTAEQGDEDAKKMLEKIKTDSDGCTSIGCLGASLGAFLRWLNWGAGIGAVIAVIPIVRIWSSNSDNNPVENTIAFPILFAFIGNVTGWLIKITKLNMWSKVGSIAGSIILLGLLMTVWFDAEDDWIILPLILCPIVCAFVGHSIGWIVKKNQKNK
jgi:hypothetical protein